MVSGRRERYGFIVVRQEPAASLGRRIGALGLTVCLMVGTLVVGWLAWSIVEWRHGRTPGYRLLGLRVVRRDNEVPVGLGRSFLRSGICCPLLVVPTAVVGSIVLLCFAFGASPPDGLFSQPRRAPWDVLTATTVLDERTRPTMLPGAEFRPIDPIDLTGVTAPDLPRSNGHTLN
jgi:RDD family